MTPKEHCNTVDLATKEAINTGGNSRPRNMGEAVVGNLKIMVYEIFNFIK